MGYYNMRPDEHENMKLIKTNTVLIRRPILKSKYGIKKFAPFICLSGFWLNDYGFEIGKRFEVLAGNNRLVLNATEFKYKRNQKSKKEVYK
jgi:hypothetical protein